MEISPETSEFIRRVEDFSNRKLKNTEELALLVELAISTGQREKIEKLAFLSKFLWNTYGILKRSNSETEGYEKLTGEFQVNLERVITELSLLIEPAPTETKRKFSSTFLAMTQESFENLILLLYDLSWVKNWFIEQKSLS